MIACRESATKISEFAVVRRTNLEGQGSSSRSIYEYVQDITLHVWSTLGFSDMT